MYLLHRYIFLYKYCLFIFLDEIIFDKLLFLAWLDRLVILLRLSSWLGLVWEPRGILRTDYNMTQRHYWQLFYFFYSLFDQCPSRHEIFARCYMQCLSGICSSSF